MDTVTNFKEICTFPKTMDEQGCSRDEAFHTCDREAYSMAVVYLYLYVKQLVIGKNMDQWEIGGRGRERRVENGGEVKTI